MGNEDIPARDFGRLEAKVEAVETTLIAVVAKLDAALKNQEDQRVNNRSLIAITGLISSAAGFLFSKISHWYFTGVGG